MHIFREIPPDNAPQTNSVNYINNLMGVKRSTATKQGKEASDFNPQEHILVKDTTSQSAYPQSLLDTPLSFGTNLEKDSIGHTLDKEE